MESEIQPQIPFSPEEFQAYFQEKSVPARKYVQGWEAQQGGTDRKVFRNFRKQVLEGIDLQIISGFPEEVREVFELATTTKIDPDWGDPPEKTTNYLAQKSAEFILSIIQKRQPLLKACAFLVWQEMEAYSRITDSDLELTMVHANDVQWFKYSWTFLFHERVGFYLLNLLRENGLFNSKELSEVYVTLDLFETELEQKELEGVSSLFFCAAIRGMLQEIIDPIRSITDAETIFSRGIVVPESKGINYETLHRMGDEILNHPDFQDRIVDEPIKEIIENALGDFQEPLTDEWRIPINVLSLKQDGEVIKGYLRILGKKFYFQVANGEIYQSSQTPNHFEGIYTESQLELLRYYVLHLIGRQTGAVNFQNPNQALWDASTLSEKRNAVDYPRFNPDNFLENYQKMFREIQRLFNKKLTRSFQNKFAVSANFAKRKIYTMDKAVFIPVTGELMVDLENALTLLRTKDETKSIDDIFSENETLIDGISYQIARRIGALNKSEGFALTSCLSALGCAFQDALTRMFEGEPKFITEGIAFFACTFQKRIGYFLFCELSEDENSRKEISDSYMYLAMTKLVMSEIKKDERIKKTSTEKTLGQLSNLTDLILWTVAPIRQFSGARHIMQNCFSNHISEADEKNTEGILSSSFGRDIPPSTTLTFKKDEVLNQDVILLLEPDNTNEFLAHGRLFTSDDYKMASEHVRRTDFINNNRFFPFTMIDASDLSFYVTHAGSISLGIFPDAIDQILSPQDQATLQYYVHYAIQGITDTGYVEIPPPRGVKPPAREREWGLPGKKRIAFPRERRKIALGSKRDPKEPSDPKFRIDHRIPHSRLISSGKILSEKAFQKAQENPRVRLWAFHHDPQEQNPGKRLKPIECLDIQGNKYEDVLIQAIRIKTEYETPAHRILFETFVSEVKKGDQVRESVAEVIMKKP